MGTAVKYVNNSTCYNNNYKEKICINLASKLILQDDFYSNYFKESIQQNRFNTSLNYNPIDLRDIFRGKVKNSISNNLRFYENYKQAIDEITNELALLVSEIKGISLIFSFVGDGSISFNLELDKNRVLMIDVCLDDFSDEDNYRYYASMCIFDSNGNQIDSSSGDFYKVIRDTISKYCSHKNYVTLFV